MAVTNGKDLFSSIKETVPNPIEGFRIKYIEAAKFLDMKDLACDSRLIKASHNLYGAMNRTPFVIDDYLYAVKRSTNAPGAFELLTDDKTITFLKDKLSYVREIANDGRNIPDRDTAVFIGFMLGLVTKVDDVKKPSAADIIRKE